MRAPLVHTLARTSARSASLIKLHIMPQMSLSSIGTWPPKLVQGQHCVEREAEKLLGAVSWPPVSYPLPATPRAIRRATEATVGTPLVTLFAGRGA